MFGQSEDQRSFSCSNLSPTRSWRLSPSRRGSTARRMTLPPVWWLTHDRRIFAGEEPAAWIRRHVEAKGRYDSDFEEGRNELPSRRYGRLPFALNTPMTPSLSPLYDFSPGVATGQTDSVRRPKKFQTRKKMDSPRAK